MLCGMLARAQIHYLARQQKKDVYAVDYSHTIPCSITATSFYNSRPQAQTPFKLFKILCNKTLNHMTVIIDQKYLQKLHALFTCISYKHVFEIQKGIIYPFLTWKLCVVFVRFWFDTWNLNMAGTLMVNSCDRIIWQPNIPSICRTIQQFF